MRVLVDTNILLRSVQPNHPLCESVLTFNSIDFERFTNVRAIHPSSLTP